MCHWSSWQVVDEERLALYTPKANYTDMQGAIKVAKFLLPSVKFIFVFCGGAPDIVYFLSGDTWDSRRVQEL